MSKVNRIAQIFRKLNLLLTMTNPIECGQSLEIMNIPPYKLDS